MSKPIPSRADLQRYSVNRKGEQEVTRQTLYDTQLYATAGMAQLQFFTLPQGQGLSAAPGNANNPKGLADTNMELAGQLPSPKAMIVESIEVDFTPGGSATANTFTIRPPMIFVAVAAQTVNDASSDVNAFYKSGFLKFFIGSKDYLIEGPLGRFPPKTRLEGDFAVASNSATTGEINIAIVKAGGRPYYLEPPVSLFHSQNWNVTLNWPIAVATPSSFNGRVQVILDGYLFRDSQ